MTSSPSGLRAAWLLAFGEMLKRRDWRYAREAGLNVIAIRPPERWSTGVPVMQEKEF